MKTLLQFKDPKIQQMIDNYGSWIAIATLALLLTVINSCSHSSRQDANESQPPDSIATHIPAGFVLVPINIENYENLDQILGNYGTVDLYEKIESQQKTTSRLVARGVKAIRPPTDETQLGLLVPESQAHVILAAQGSLFVTVHNPHKSGTEIVNKVKKASRIIYAE